MTERAYGCRHSDFRPTLVGAASLPDLPSPAAYTDLRKFCTYVDDQIGEECVGEAFSGAHWVATRGIGKRASKRGIYVGARVRERSRKTDPIPDIGCDPADAIDSLITPGIYPMDARDFDPAAVTQVGTWDELVACQPFDPSQIVPIERGDTDTLDAMLTTGNPVVDWFMVDDSWNSLGAGVIWPGAGSVPRGGHATVVAGYDHFNGRDFYWIWNSYGPGWANAGFGMVDAELFRTGQVGMVAIVGGPVL